MLVDMNGTPQYRHQNTLPHHLLLDFSVDNKQTMFMRSESREHIQNTVEHLIMGTPNH